MLGMSRLCSATFEQRFAQLFSVRATSSNFFLLEHFLSNFSLEFKLYSMKCLHVIENFIFLLPTSKNPGYEVASFSVIFLAYKCQFVMTELEVL